MSANETRQQIVEAADALFYHQGFEKTSFSDIADAVRISRGNFYYHFKSKDEILDAVIDDRLTATRLALDSWETDAKGPADCIRSFINILIANRADIKKYGCPIGTLSTELGKLDHVSRAAANRLFTLFRIWLCEQFALLGCGENADRFAMHLLARSQGVATLAAAYRDDDFIRREVKEMSDWFDACVEPTAGASRRAG